MKIATKEISEERTYQIAELILDAHSNYEIVKFCSKEWNISERQVYKYIVFARKQIEKTYRREFKESLSWHMVTRKKLVRRLIKNKDDKGAGIVLKDMAELQGYYKNKFEHSGDKDNPITVLTIVPPGEDSE